ncbi:glycosyltransferase family 2 protein [Mesotoga sp. UBA5825]|uniref:glycosyltransferase family 2 protein n=1 Tax=Mesotoga sp. UBA5825 TaxID=1946858 RepID=UPI0025D6B9E9|nr:glycosyltransferase [Mesotoga sp. UBA5825]
MKDQIVTVIVPTYNHEEFVVECLESVKAQDYRHIELIVADDCSSDRTVEKIDIWLSKNRERFTECKIIVQNENSGTTSNLNAALQQSTGAYIKFIAGDDFLDNTALTELVSFVNHESNIMWVCGQVVPLIRSENEEVLLSPKPGKRSARYFGYDAWTQFKCLSIDNFVPAPGVLFQRQAIETGFDSSYRILEDYPTWLRLTNMGHPVRLLQKPVAYWRRHSTSTSASAFGRINTQYFVDNLNAIRKLINPNLDKTDMFVRRFVKSKEIYIARQLIEKGNLENYRTAGKLNRFRKAVNVLGIYDFLRRAFWK